MTTSFCSPYYRQQNIENRDPYKQIGTQKVKKVPLQFEALLFCTSLITHHSWQLDTVYLKPENKHGMKTEKLEHEN